MKTSLKILFILCLSILIIKAEAQYEDSIRLAIKTHYTEEEVILKARDLMRIRLEASDVAGCRELQKYLGENYMENAISRDEIEALAFLRGDFSLLLDVDYLKKIQQGNTWHYDAFGRKLQSTIHNQEASIKTRISMASLSQKERDFLSILLAATYKLPYTYMRDTVLVELVDQFLFTYPEKDEMRDYIQERFIPPTTERTSFFAPTDKRDFKEAKRMHRETRREYKYGTLTRPDGWGFMWSFGLNFNIYNGELARHLKSGAGMFMGIDVSYKSFLLLLQYGFSRAKIKNDIAIDNKIYSKDSSHLCYNMDIMFGYNVFDHSYFRVIPFGGISWSFLEVDNSTLKEKSEMALSQKVPHAVVGCGIDYKLGRNIALKKSEKLSERYFPVRLQYKYHIFPFGKKHEDMKGGIHQITVSIGMGGITSKLKTPKE